MDSGTEASMVRRELVQDMKFETYQGEPTYVVSAGGQMLFAEDRAVIGPINALIMKENISVNLLSCSQLTDMGYVISFFKNGGDIKCEWDPEVMVRFKRKNGLYVIELQDLMKLPQGQQGVHDRLVTNCHKHLYNNWATKTQRKIVEDLHGRLGHLPLTVMKKSIESGAWAETGVSVQDIDAVFRDWTCAECILAKQRRLNRVKGRTIEDAKDVAVGELIACDPVGPITPRSKRGARWLFIFVDQKTSYLHVFAVKQKSDFIACLEQVITWWRVKGHRMKTLRCDSENVLMSRDVKQLLDDNGISTEYSAPYQHQQNGLVERQVQVVTNGVISLLHGQHWMGAAAWDWAAEHFAYIKNNSINKKSNLSPAQQVDGTILDCERQCQFKFGDIVAVHVPEDLKQWKFDLKNEIGLYVGQPIGSVNSSIVYFPGTGSTKNRGDVVKLNISDDVFLKYLHKKEDIRSKKISQGELKDVLRLQMAKQETITWDAKSKDPEVTELAIAAVLDQEALPLLEEQALVKGLEGTYGEYGRLPGHDRALRSGKKATMPTASKLKQPAVRKDTRNENRPILRLNSHKTKLMSREGQRANELVDLHLDIPVRAQEREDLAQEFDEEEWLKSVMRHSALHAEAQIAANRESTKTVLEGPEAEFYKDSIRKEILEVLFNPDKPTLRKEHPSILGSRKCIIRKAVLIHSKKLKNDELGTLDKYKSRAAFNGYGMQGITAETFSPTIGALSLSLIHQIVVQEELESCSVDTIAAYLSEEYPDEEMPLYMTFDDRVSDLCGLERGASYRVIRYLYGIPESGRSYYLGFSRHMRAHGYSISIYDPCLYFKVEGNRKSYLFSHVDDCFIAGTTKQECEDIMKVLKSKYEIKVDWQVESYLGVQFVKLDDGSTMLRQPKLLNAIFEEHLPHLRKGLAKALSAQRDKKVGKGNEEVIDIHMFLRLIGQLIYLTKSRPDISTAVSFGAVHGTHPTIDDWEDLMHTVCYLWNTKDWGLIIKRSPGMKNKLTLYCYVDASYLTHEDSKSHTGYILCFGEVGPFYCKSTKQTLVTTSSTHSEMRALYQALLQIIFVVELCSEIMQPVLLPVTIYEDNQPVLELLSQDISRGVKKSKHFLMLIHFVREHVRSGLIEVKKIPTLDNMADVLTKVVTGSEFLRKAKFLLGMQDGM